MNDCKRYFTLGFGHPNGLGYVVVNGIDGEQCREIMWRLTGGRFAFGYESLDGLHHLDRRLRCEVSGCTSENSDGFVIVVDEVAEGCDLTLFEGYKFIVNEG